MSLVRQVCNSALLALAACSATPAFAELAKFDLRHEGGRCSDRKFSNNKMLWSSLSGKRIDIATGETISVHLYGHGADMATDADPATAAAGCRGR